MSPNNRGPNLKKNKNKKKVWSNGPTSPGRSNTHRLNMKGLGLKSTKLDFSNPYK